MYGINFFAAAFFKRSDLNEREAGDNAFAAAVAILNPNLRSASKLVVANRVLGQYCDRRPGNFPFPLHRQKVIRATRSALIDDGEGAGGQTHIERNAHRPNNR